MVVDELGMVRFALQASDEAAVRTQAFRRARVKTVAEDGSLTVTYKGKEIVLDNGSTRKIVKGEWLELVYSNGMLTISGRTSYGQ